LIITCRDSDVNYADSENRNADRSPMCLNPDFQDFMITGMLNR